MLKFPGVLAAARKREASHWKMGDALIAELGPPQRSLKAYAVVAEQVDIPTERLKRLHQIAFAFPADRRHPISWSFHEAAQSPEMLDVLIKGWPKVGKPFTTKWIR